MIWCGHTISLRHTHTIKHTHTNTLTSEKLVPWRAKDKDGVKELARSREWRAAGNQWEQKVTECGNYGNQASADKRLISGRTVRSPGWFPGDVHVSTLQRATAEASLLEQPFKLMLTEPLVSKGNRGHLRIQGHDVHFGDYIKNDVINRCLTDGC